MEKIFAYGTLLDAAIQWQLFGREIIPVAKATLRGWKKMSDKEYPYLVEDKKGSVRGSIIELTEEELSIADQWEEVPREYKRLKLTATLHPAGEVMVWVYVSANTDP